MNNINLRFSSKFSSHWVKVNFYNQKPDLKGGKRLNNVRFCEATKKAILHPVLLDKESVSCPGAQYAFGWMPDYKDDLLESCYSKGQAQKNVLKSMLSQMPHFKKPFKYIGLNIEGVPDMIISYMAPGKIMNLIKVYHNHQGKNLDVSLSSMMSICGNVAVSTYLEEKITLSFGCNDSREYTDMGREYLAIGIPRKLFNMFVD
ncbi:MAG: DUF169 domain-containing protein [Candidatus Saelkia tenebricola]|nr:DUF169 domain-containing protein [Candidatus Saelkia tenebricola]